MRTYRVFFTLKDNQWIFEETTPDPSDRIREVAYFGNTWPLKRMKEAMDTYVERGYSFEEFYFYDPESEYLEVSNFRTTYDSTLDEYYVWSVDEKGEVINLECLKHQGNMVDVTFSVSKNEWSISNCAHVFTFKNNGEDFDRFKEYIRFLRHGGMGVSKLGNFTILD